MRDVSAHERFRPVFFQQAMVLARAYMYIRSRAQRGFLSLSILFTLSGRRSLSQSLSLPSLSQSLSLPSLSQSLSLPSLSQSLSLPSLSQSLSLPARVIAGVARKQHTPVEFSLLLGLTHPLLPLLLAFLLQQDASVHGRNA